MPTTHTTTRFVPAPAVPAPMARSAHKPNPALERVATRTPGITADSSANLVRRLRAELAAVAAERDEWYAKCLQLEEDNAALQNELSELRASTRVVTRAPRTTATTQYHSQPPQVNNNYYITCSSPAELSKIASGVITPGTIRQMKPNEKLKTDYLGMATYLRSKGLGEIEVNGLLTTPLRLIESFKDNGGSVVEALSY